MARANTIQTNFTSGELSPNMYGRVDVSKYFNGARKLQSVICLPQGGLRTTPGTKYLGVVKDSTKKTLLRPFTFSQNDSYVLEFGHQVIRVWQSGALVGSPVEIVTPYSHDDIAGLRFAQSADVLFIAHEDYYPRTLTRNSPTSWTLATYDNQDGPYAAVTPDVTMQLSNVQDLATATSVASIFSTTGSAANVSAVGVQSTASYQWVKITTSAAHGFVTGDKVLLQNVGGVPEANGAWIVDVSSTTVFFLYGCRKSPTSAWTSGGTAIKCSTTHVEFREDNVWKVAQLKSITSGTVATVDVVSAIKYPDPITKITVSAAAFSNVTASNSGVFGSNDAYKMLRPNPALTGATSWPIMYGFVDSSNMTEVPSYVVNLEDPSKEVTVTGRSITATLTASTAYFASTDVGRWIRLKYGASWVIGLITAYTSSTVVTVALEDEVPLDTGAAYKLYNDGKTDTWKIEAWGSVQGYPSTVAFHQNRLVWGGNTAEPSAHWMTKSGDYYTFEPSDPATSAVADDNSISITLISRQVNKARWMDSGPVLLCGTEGAEWQIKPSSIQQTITPTNISATVQTSYGSADLDASRVGAQTLFIDRSGLKLRELKYDFSIDAFQCTDISILSEHILREHGGVVDWSIQRSPYNIIWIVLGDGNVATVTYEKEHEVVAWSMQDIGGIVESVCCATTPANEDVVYLVVKRTINGSTVRYVESITGLLAANSVYVNCHKLFTYSSAATASVTAAHLAAATVGVMVDGVYIGDKTASGSGVISTTYSGHTLTVNSIVVGLRKTQIVGLLDPEGGSQAGSSQGKKKRITESCARVVSSWYFKTAAGTQVTNETENLSASVDPTSADYTSITPAFVVLNDTNDGVNPITHVSGDITFSVDNAFDDGARFQIVQDEPYPLNITAVMHKLNTNE